MKNNRLSPVISVIIPCTRDWHIVNCIKAFNEQEYCKGMELIIIGIIPKKVPIVQFPVIFIPENNKHSNYRRNKGLKVSRGDIIAFMDDDALPCKGWLETALTLDKIQTGIFTGPEIPYKNNITSHLIYQARKTSLLEGTKSHVNPLYQRVNWFEVPFCNCVFARSLLEIIGFPSVDVPCDMDDFEFCFRALNSGYEFISNPQLKIMHDRYPDKFGAYINDVFKMRIRTGEKFITYPQVYTKIPKLWFLAITPYLFLLCTFCGGNILIIFISSFIILYCILILVQGVRLKQGNIRQKLCFILLFPAIHFVTIVGFHVGALRIFLFIDRISSGNLKKHSL